MGLIPNYLDKDLVNNSIIKRTEGDKNLEAFIKDSRDGKSYRIVEMPDGKWWMAENLDFTENLIEETRFVSKNEFGDFYSSKELRAVDKEFLCQKDTQGICIRGKVSYRYTNTIQELCPEGWELPTSEDWANMLNIIEKIENGKQNHILETDVLTELNKGSIQKAAYTLKSTTANWDYSLDGNKPLDKYGFSVEKATISKYEFNETFNVFGYFYSQEGYSPFWTSSEVGDYVYVRIIYPNFNFVGNMKFHKFSFLPIRCIKK